MTFSTPYFIYIVGAYAVTAFGLALLLSVTLYQWKRSKDFLHKISHEA